MMHKLHHVSFVYKITVFKEQNHQNMKLHRLFTAEPQNSLTEPLGYIGPRSRTIALGKLHVKAVI